jgi:hypothetical protein
MQNSEFRIQKARAFGSRSFLHSAFSILNCTLLLACSGAPPSVRVSQSKGGAYEAALGTNSRGFGVAWYDTRDGNPEIYFRLLDVNGQPAGPEHRLTAGPDASYEPSIECVGDSLIVAWYEQTSQGQQTAMLGAWDRNGRRKWAYPIAPASRNPVIRTGSDAIVAAWIQAEPDGTEHVWVGTWDSDGNETRQRARVGAASRTTWNLNLALDGPDPWVVFDAATSTRSSELYLGRVDGSGAHLARLTRDDGVTSKYPDIAIDDQKRIALTWYDMRDGNDEVYLLVGRGADLRGEIDARARRITVTPGESIGAYVAWNAGRVGLAWSDKTSAGHEIYFESFDGDGNALGAAERLTRTEAWSLVPAIRAWQNGFALAWTEYSPASNELHDGTGEIAFMIVE